MNHRVILNGLTAQSRRGLVVQDVAQRVGAEVVVTEQAGDFARLVREAADEEIERLIIAGGDGSLHEAVQGLAPDFPAMELGLVPLGTGNDLARSLGIDLNDIRAATEQAFSSEAVAIDVVEISSHHKCYFVNAASGGFGGSVTVDVTKAAKQNWGAFAYWFTALSKFSRLPEYQVELEGPGLDYRGKVVGVAINNGVFVGGGFPLATDAKLNDGLLAVTIVPVAPPLELIALAADVALGRSRDPRKLIFVKTPSLKLTSSPCMPFSLDGEPEQSALHEFRLLPGRLRIAAGKSPALLGTV
jgi:YegS/Rv2252/BmrU family lipid kinase